VSGGEPDPVMTVPEVSAYLKIAESTVYRLVKERRLPGRKVGGAWRFSRPELERWLANPLEGDGSASSTASETQDNKSQPA
jgi:excisionase family DNA binding protein